MEEWKDIPGYEGRYMASSLGRIKSMKRIVNAARSRRLIKESILTAFRCGNGYMAVNFVFGGRKQFLMHRLIAKTFLPEIEGKSHVNHKDFDRTNNAVSNLEWCSPKENIAHSCEGERNGRIVLNIENGIYYYTAIEAGQSLGLTKDRVHKMLVGTTRNITPLRYV